MEMHWPAKVVNSLPLSLSVVDSQSLERSFLFVTKKRKKANVAAITVYDYDQSMKRSLWSHKRHGGNVFSPK